MRLLQGLVSRLHGSAQTLFGLLHLVARDVLVALHIRTDGKEDGSLVGTYHTQDAIAVGHLAPFGLHCHTTLEANLPLQSLVLARYAQQDRL